MYALAPAVSARLASDSPPYVRLHREHHTDTFAHQCVVINKHDAYGRRHELPLFQLCCRRRPRIYAIALGIFNSSSVPIPRSLQTVNLCVRLVTIHRDDSARSSTKNLIEISLIWLGKRAARSGRLDVALTETVRTKSRISEVTQQRNPVDSRCL
jgi:hypothetical protein